jgi:hypothetical protein
MNRHERCKAIIDQASRGNSDGVRYSAETVGYLASWVVELQDDILQSEHKEWWEHQDKDEAYIKTLQGE